MIVMDKEAVFRNLMNGIININSGETLNATKKVIELGIDPLEAIEKGLSAGTKIIGEKFQKLEVFLPELIMATDIFNEAMKILKPEIDAKKITQVKKGKIIIGTVHGDIHDIGKDIVAMLLEVDSYEVHNLGENIPTSAFIDEAQKIGADFIGLSSLLTSTMPTQKDLIDALIEKGIRDKYIVIVGGGPATSEWADEIGADGYAETAADAVTLVNKLLKN